MEDTLAHALVDQYPTVTPMGVTAENLATKYGISRQDCDDYALSSQKRWAAGVFLSVNTCLSSGSWPIQRGNRASYY
jgi:acetyl-CoA acetyltransferase